MIGRLRAAAAAVAAMLPQAKLPYGTRLTRRGKLVLSSGTVVELSDRKYLVGMDGVWRRVREEA